MTDRMRRALLPSAGNTGDRVLLDPEESHHAARVLRLKRGDALNVFDGAGREWAATIEDVTGDRVAVVLGQEVEGRVEAPLRVVLYQANVRPEKLEWVLQKGTELGVAAFRIVVTERVEAPAPSPARLTRYRRILLTACKQSGRRVLPELAVGGIETPGADVAAIVLTQEAPALGKVLQAEPPHEVWIVVGPEGGFTDAELSALAGRGFLAASLGPRVLRTETAGAVAAAVVFHTWGDLGPV
jgi:16S rRNA (uracil1498-N3)-methyltransferase